MTPYYSDSLATIYHGNCEEITFPDSDLVVMDPPFDIWSSVKKISGTTVIAFTTWQYRQYVHDLYGFPRTELIWYFKDGRWVSHTLPRITHETILVFGPTYSSYVGENTDGITRPKGNGSVGKDKMAYRFYVPRERKSLNSVLPFSRSGQITKGAGIWTKPLQLMTQLIEWTTKPEDTVFDPYMGAGTTLLAAKNLGRKSVGIELDEKRCESAAKRLQGF